MNNDATTATAATTACKGIITYKRFKNDQAVACALLQMFGREKYPGIDKAPFIFWEVNQGTPDGRSAAEWENDGYVLIAVADGKYDDHSSKHRNIKTCCAVLVAEDLGIADMPYTEGILKHTLHRDLTGEGHPMMIYTFLKFMHDQYPDRPADVMAWYLQAIDAYIVSEYNLFKKTGEEFKKVSTVVSCQHAGKKITVASFISDDTEMAKFARSKHGAKADVTIQKNLKGQVCILTKNNSYINLAAVIRLLRLEEKKIGGTNVFIAEDELVKPGTLPQIKEWYYDHNARRILNGSGAAASTPATKVPFERIIQLILTGLQKVTRNVYA